MSNRGVHLHPSPYHGYWCGDETRRDLVLHTLKDMHMDWVVILTAGDSALEKFDGKEVVRHFLELGINPIIRDYAKFPTSFQNLATVERMVNIYADNEPRDDREWNSGTAPDWWWSKAVEKWSEAAVQVAQVGARPGFPDGPNYDFIKQHPFRETLGIRWLWDENIAWYGVHAYGKGRPVNYPYDDVSRYGLPLTEEQFAADLDDYAGDPRWQEPSLDMINAQRQLWADPEVTIEQDDTCWLTWMKINIHAVRTLGHPVDMAVVEGGWVPRDRAGSNPTDYRWPLTTPNMVAKKTLRVYEENNPLFAICPWLFAGDFMGHGGWEFDSWWTWAYMDKYGLFKPVVQTLMDNPPATNRWTRISHIVKSIAARYQGWQLNGT